MLKKIASTGGYMDKGSKVMIIIRNSSSEINQARYREGIITGRRYLVFFTVRDTSGNESEYHLFDLKFLEREENIIHPKR